MASSQNHSAFGLAANLGASLNINEQQAPSEMKQYKDYYEDLLLKQLDYYPEIMA